MTYLEGVSQVPASLQLTSMVLVVAFQSTDTELVATV